MRVRYSCFPPHNLTSSYKSKARSQFASQRNSNSIRRNEGKLLSKCVVSKSHPALKTWSKEQKSKTANLMFSNWIYTSIILWYNYNIIYIQNQSVRWDHRWFLYSFFWFILFYVCVFLPDFTVVNKTVGPIKAIYLYWEKYTNLILVFQLFLIILSCPLML